MRETVVWQREKELLLSVMDGDGWLRGKPSGLIGLWEIGDPGLKETSVESEVERKRFTRDLRKV